MSSMNKALLIGRVTRDPELRQTNGGKPVANFGVAVDRPRSAGRERETDFLDVVAWQQTAEFVSKYALKGRLVAVDGRIHVRSYEANDGTKRKAWEIVANDVRLLDRAPDASGANVEAEVTEDIPF